MDNYWILGKSVEIKVSSKMAGYKMNLPFNADLLKYNVAKDCLKPYNKINGVNGEYYREACACQKATVDCIQKTLSEKAIGLLVAYKYVPSGSIAVNVKNLTDEEIWDIHRKLVDEYNDFVDKYILVDSKALNKYKKIQYIK